MCKVSVLVPVYDVKPYLRQCLDSLVAQTLRDIEFICIDDGSTDGSERMLDEYAARDARFRVIHKPNSGYGASMNVGLRAAHGEYIGIVESDDFAAPEMFLSLVEAADSAQAEVVKSNYWTFDGSRAEFMEALRGQPYHQVLRPVRDDAALFFSPASIWTCLYRRDFLESKGIRFNETPGASFQDTSFAFLTKACAERFLLVPEAYLHYRINNAGSSVKSKGKIYSIIDEYDAMEAYLATYHGEDAQRLHELAAEVFFGIFGFNENRLSRDAWVLFWQKAYPKLVTAQKHGWFHQDLGPDMESWMFQRFQMCQTAELLFEGFKTWCREGKSVCLYGAGQVGTGLLAALKRCGCSVSCFLVSDGADAPAAVEGVPVYALQEAPVEREQVTVLIAVSPRKPEVQQEIFTALHQAGYRDVLVLTRELQLALGRL